MTTILFDLDGTLLPMEQEKFLQAYFGGLTRFAAPYGYAPKDLIDALWKGTGEMVKNNGEALNREVFWDAFAAQFGEDARAREQDFERFYATEFDHVRHACGFAPEARYLISSLKALGVRCVLATNPIFPAVATEARIRWAGLAPEDFSYITTYENSRHCKPNPAYYADILAELDCEPSECLMIGNDASEDLAAMELGIPVFLLTPCLINTKNRDISDIPHGGFSELELHLRKILPNFRLR